MKKKSLLISGILIMVAGYLLFSCKQQTAAPEKIIAQNLLQQIDDFARTKDKLQFAIEQGASNEELQKLFLNTRLAYKKIEWATEYFSPVVSRFVNGPPVEEVEVNAQVLAPAGLQVMETYLYPLYDSTKKKELIAELKGLDVACEQYRSYLNNIALLNWQVFDATKLEMFRIITLGITGFDNALSQNSMRECVASLQSMKTVLNYYIGDKDTEQIGEKIDDAINYLKQHTDFNTFDRATFITQYANPISAGINDLKVRMNMPVITYNRLLNQDAGTLFDTDAYNVNAYIPDQSYYITKEKIALGKKLFADPMLSGTGTRSCQSCHQPEKAFTDGLVKNTAINSDKPLRRNTPTLLNAALQAAQFYDLRVNTLEEQSISVVQNPDEMHGSLHKAIKLLWKDEKYRKLFSAAFPKAGRSNIDTSEVMNAIGSYIRSLTTLNSRFDTYMRGNRTAMNETEIRGFNLFMGKAKCGTCHYMPLFNGTLPPRYMRMETEVIGVPAGANDNTLDSDMGRYNIIRVASLKHSFKIPTLRNAARTAPYMHNGAFATLEQVVDFYNKGGGAGLDMHIENQTLPFDKLNLSKKECDELVAFLKTLDSQ
ncbi:MAG: cytochrome C peroxidase [Bacteroidetes bacterium]|nr:cytochrome C peroxidase [Bacteroidota bacterium]